MNTRDYKSNCECKKDWTIEDAKPGDVLRNGDHDGRSIRTTIPIGERGAVVGVETVTAMSGDVSDEWRPDDRVFIGNEQ